MKIKDMLGVRIVALMALSVLLAVNCAEKGTPPDVNIPPNTLITGFQIDIAPDSATMYNTRIYWSGSDVDGAVYWYDWRIINADGDSVFMVVVNSEGVSETRNISDWQATRALNNDLRLDFPTFDTKYVFEVRGQDNDHEFDPTPAIDTVSVDRIRDFNYAPNTEIVEGPGDGDLTCTGIHFVILGTDLDGAVDTIEYMIDTDTSWTKKATDISTSTLTFDLLDVPLGARTISFRSIDNFREPDPTPVSTSIIVVDTLTPDLTVVAGPIPAAFYYLPAGGTTLDLSATWSGSAAWYFSTVEFRYAVDDSSTWSDWTAATNAVLPGLDAGAHEFFVEARDLAGGMSLYMTDFGIGELVSDRGVLVVDGISQADYGAEFDDFWNGVGNFGGFSFDFWDTFGGQDYSSIPSLDSTYIGSGVLPGDTLAHYSSMVMIMNAFSGDLEVYQSMFPLIMSFLNAGGNVYLGARYGSQFIYGDLEDYAHIDGWDQTEVSLDPGLTAVAAGLVDMPGAGLSLADLPDLPTDPEVTLLFTCSPYPNAAAGIYVNPASGGKFVFVAGRPYRYDYAPYSANVGYMLTNYFGE